MHPKIFLALNAILLCGFASSLKNKASFVFLLKSSQQSDFLSLQSTLLTVQHLAEQRRNRDSTIYQTFDSNDSTDLPPHTALAQVVANQYDIDLSSVEPKKGRGNKITAADVEYHAYKISQPPCTPQALELAYSYGLDLNPLYDGYDDKDENEEPHYLRISDVELLKDNLRSFRVSYQKIRGDDVVPGDVRRKQQHMNELEKRMEKNIVQLSEKALQAVASVGSALQSVQSQVQLTLPTDIFRSGYSKIDSVQDFDRELADEIQAALMSAGVDDEETTNLMNLLDIPRDENAAGGVNTSNQTEMKNDVKEVRKSSSNMFFADPKK